ncbi:MAG TPA: hypothetical protein ENL03_04875, partial [Phycisphaerae bacterium]|nr:hypothetical protein [Phycisphaerae bacterium]
IKAAKATVIDLVERMNEYEIYTRTLNDADRKAADALATVSRLAREGYDIYRSSKRSRGILDFTDLLDYASQLIQSNPPVRKALAKSIRQLLVDECQDTDSLQMKLISSLTEPNGKIFLVGDSKQSIYRFRGAQVEVFQQWCQSLGETQHERLDISFRTHEAGTAFINHLFAPLMGNDYSPISANRTDTPEKSSVEIILADGGDIPIDNATDASRAQAMVTAERIAQMVRDKEKIVFDESAGSFRPVRYGDIAILMSRMTKSADYERALLDAEIPFYTLAGAGFFKQQEIYDILNALRVIDNPMDDIAFFGVLRSNMFGLDDNSLMQIALSCDGPYFANLTGSVSADKLRDLLPADQSKALFESIELLGYLHKRKNAIGTAAIIDRLMESTGFESSQLSRRRGRQILGNIRQITTLARQADENAVSLANFITAIGEMTLSEMRYEQAPIAGANEDVVRIMTIHKAKGLEFPVVILPDLNASKRSNHNPIIQSRLWGLVYGSKDEDDLPALSYDLARAKEKADLRKEEIRLLYVAMTRHCDQLILVGANWQKDGRFRRGQNPLQSINEVLDISGTVSAGQDKIDYADGKYSIAIKLMNPTGNKRATSARLPGQLILNAAKGPGDIAASLNLAGAKAKSPELLGAIPITAAKTALAVTALSDFERCPMLYHLRHELAMAPLPAVDATSHTAATGKSEIDAMSLGSLLHKCMELLDFSDLQNVSLNSKALITQAAAELDLTETCNLDALETELRRILNVFTKSNLAAELAQATEIIRELDFIVNAGPAQLRGQIDLLMKDSQGRWHVVDYKSDRVSEANIPTHGRRYELQMLIYAQAAEKFLNQPLTDVQLFFLRAGSSWQIEIENPSTAQAQERITTLTNKLLIARRSKQYPTCKSDTCKYCPYQRLCQ